LQSNEPTLFWFQQAADLFFLLFGAELNKVVRNVHEIGFRQRAVAAQSFFTA